MLMCLFFFKLKTAYEMRISDWSSYVVSSDLEVRPLSEGHDLLGIAVQHQFFRPVELTLVMVCGPQKRKDQRSFRNGNARQFRITGRVPEQHLHRPVEAQHLFQQVWNFTRLSPNCGRDLRMLDRKSTRLNSSH